MLLMDEPTNHLDLDAIQWLEGYLKSVDVPMVIVSHDREFLDQLCTKTVEVERGVATTYKGNYSDYQRAKRSQLCDADGGVREVHEGGDAAEGNDSPAVRGRAIRPGERGR